MLSRTKSLPIVVILFLISLDIVARRLSNVLLHGILDSPHLSLPFCYMIDPLQGIHVMLCSNLI